MQESTAKRKRSRIKVVQSCSLPIRRLIVCTRLDDVLARLLVVIAWQPIAVGRPGSKIQ